MRSVGARKTEKKDHADEEHPSYTVRGSQTEIAAALTLAIVPKAEWLRQLEAAACTQWHQWMERV